MVGVTETRLISEIASSFVSMPNYQLFRCDTLGQVHKHGVGMYIHDDIQVDQVITPCSNVIALHLTHYNLYIVTAYRPPSNNATENHEMIEALKNFMTSKDVILVGDFNLPSLKWKEPGRPIVAHCSGTDQAFLDLFDSLGLHQWVTVPTFPSSGNVLDLVFTTEPDCTARVSVEAPLPACDHCPIVFDYIISNINCDTLQYGTNSKLIKKWHKGKYAKLNEFLLQVDWEHELAHKNSNESFEHLLLIVQELAQGLIPTQPMKPPHTKPPWKVRPPGRLLRQCKSAWQAYKLAREAHGRRSQEARNAFAMFSSINKQLRSYSVKAQANYEKSLIEKWKSNPKLLHAYIRSKKSAPTTVGPLKMSDGTVTSDPGQMSECLADAFCSVYTTGQPSLQMPHQVHDGNMPPLQLTVGELKALLRNTDGNTAMGPDGLHPLVLKNCADALAEPIHAIFTRSLEEGSLPDAWKKSLVVPIFKKGLRLDPLNYRPVCLTSVCCKRLERKLSDHIYEYLSSSSLLSSHQFGFRPGFSSSEQLLLVYEEVSAGVDKGNTVDVVLFDYSKAFDVVPHSILLNKLKLLGFDRDILRWISSFLTDRLMEVGVKDKHSTPRTVTSGVPQGSVLGPLLFLIYINHIGSQLSCRYKIFADDLKIYACGREHGSDEVFTDLQSAIQKDIDILASTSTSWGLFLNPKKCAVLRFSRPQRELPQYVLDGKVLPSPKTHSDLGVTIDTSLKFHDHISLVTRKVAGLGYGFLRSTVCREREFMLFYLTVHLRPILEYGSCLWHTDYVEDACRLERFQRHWTKQIDGMEHLSYGDRLRQLCLYSVRGRLARADLIQYWRILHGKSCIAPETMFLRPATRITRGHSYKIGVTHVNTDARKRAFAKRSVNIWNSLPECVVSANDVSTFKRELEMARSDLLFDYL